MREFRPKSIKREVRLERWAEVIGKYHGLNSDDSFTYVRIGNRFLVFPNSSRETEVLRESLRDEWVGYRIGILRTGETTRPLLARVLNFHEERSTDDKGCV